MVKFGTLATTSGSSSEIDPRKLFQHLVKPEGVNELYASQSEILSQWFENRGNQDSVLKLPTGGGKSIVGLLIAQSTMNELRESALYLVPTRQLVEQVENEAKRFGIPVCTYLSSKDGISGEYYDARAVCVTTYDAVFNGRSKFGTSTKSTDLPKPGIIILDDAHAAFETVWDNFTFNVAVKEHKDLYNDLCARFRAAFNAQGRQITFDEVVEGKDSFILEVPYWEWLARTDEIGKAVSAYGAEKVDLFSWPHVRDELNVCHALISRQAFSIVPILPSVARVTAYALARRRVFMSATIADDSEVVRTFGAQVSGVKTPLVAASLAGVGERMILAPALIPLPSTVPSDSLIPALIKDVSSKDKNTVILTTSFRAAELWNSVATIPKNREESVELINLLHDKRGVAVVLPRRYDGVDLPGEDCRLLVLDGLPYGESAYDAWRMSVLSSGAGNAVLAQRIEQAMGRGSRGTGDYCVVNLSGADLVHWLGRSANQQYLSSGTKKQLEIGLIVSKAVGTSEEFIETAWQCLSRDPEWRAYHANEMASAAQPAQPDATSLDMWAAERSGTDQLRIGNFTSAINYFDSAIDLATDAATKGWFHQLKARAAYQSGDAARADEWQAKAYGLNMRLTKPQGDVAFTKLDPPGQQALLICHRLSEYMHPGVAISAFDESSSMLVSYATANQFEGALEKLFKWLGFNANRPDDLYKIGPDVLALDEAGFAIIIEAKSRKKQKNKFTKSLHGQVLNHENWFNAKYAPNAKRQRVVVYPTTESESNAGTHDTLVLTFDALAAIISDTRKMLQACASVPPEQCATTAAQKTIELKLNTSGLVERLSNFSDVQ